MLLKACTVAHLTIGVVMIRHYWHNEGCPILLLDVKSSGVLLTTTSLVKAMNQRYVSGDFTMQEKNGDKEGMI